MYIEKTRGYYTSDGQQNIERANFLILMTPKTDHKAPVRAIVRKVAMSQFGHFMMGTARIKGHSLALSGSYGADGLILSVPQEVYSLGVILPNYLYNAWNNGGGWNSAGSEASAMRAWANANLLFLTRDPSHDKQITSFDGCLHYVNRLGFTVKPGFPGWIPQAQARLSNACHVLYTTAGQTYTFTVHYERKARRFIVNNSVVINAQNL